MTPTPKAAIPRADDPVGHVAQFTSITLWTVGLVWQKQVAESIDRFVVVAGQMVLAGIILWGLALVIGLPPIPRRRVIQTIAWGMLAPGGVLVLGIWGASLTDGVTLSLMWGLVPLLVPIGGRLFLKERFHWSLAVGAVVGFAGLILVSFDRMADGTGNLAGNLLVFLSVLCAVASQVIGRALNTKGVPWHQTASLQVTGAAITATVVALVASSMPDMETLQAAGWVGPAYLVLGMTVGNFLVFNLALSRLPVAWVSLYVTLAPAIGALTAVILLGERIDLDHGIGIVVVITGAMIPHVSRLVTHRNDRQTKAA